MGAMPNRSCSFRSQALGRLANVGQALGGQAIGIGVAYFTVAMLITALLLLPVAKATYRVNEGEGYFRFRHARLKEFAECGTMCDGPVSKRGRPVLP